MDYGQPPTEQTRQYTGTPEEVGAMLAVDALGPTIQAAMQNQPMGQVARMLAGMIAGLTGMVAENFGAGEALDMIRGTAANLEANTGAFDGSQH